jgi:5'-methylthioadenosine phosphorylase
MAATIPTVDVDTVHDVSIGVIGGSGFYGVEHLTPVCQVFPDTPWGKPSDAIIISKTDDGHKIAFLARHGKGHSLNPTEVPVRANIAALKRLGVKCIIAFSAVGSLREELVPRHFVLPNQIIDRTKYLRPNTFFENGVCAYTGFADPFDPEVADILFRAAAKVEGLTIHKDKTLVCMEGPAFSTRAESHMYRALGGDIINMSVVPEAKLAREAEIPYQMVCMSTDYDCWKEHEEAVSVESVLLNLSGNTENGKRLLEAALPELVAALDGKTLKGAQALEGSMRFACITKKECRNPEQVKKLEYILPGYF